jgi:hypothetical protein
MNFKLSSIFFALVLLFNLSRAQAANLHQDRMLVLEAVESARYYDFMRAWQTLSFVQADVSTLYPSYDKELVLRSIGTAMFRLNDPYLAPNDKVYFVELDSRQILSGLDRLIYSSGPIGGGPIGGGPIGGGPIGGGPIGGGHIGGGGGFGGPKFIVKTLVARGTGGTTQNDKQAACSKAEERAHSEALMMCANENGMSESVRFVEIAYVKKSGNERVCRVDAQLKCRVRL